MVLNKIDYYYLSLSERTCRYKQDCFLSETGRVKIKRQLGNNTFNQFIIDSHSNIVCIGSQSDIIEISDEIGIFNSLDMIFAVVPPEIAFLPLNSINVFA